MRTVRLEKDFNPGFPDPRELGPLQLAYLGDTLHDLYIRSRLVARHATVGEMHRTATKLVNCSAQAAMLTCIEPELTEEEAEVVRRGRNAQAKHAAPKHAEPGEYEKATGLESLWGWLYISGRTERLNALLEEALAGTEEKWGSQS